MISSNIQYLRKQKNLSQQELADRFSVPRSTLGDYERGKTEPNIEMLLRLSNFFGKSVDDLLRANLADSTIKQQDQLKVLAVSLDHNQNSHIEIVDTKAEAGYLESFRDPEYISDLPKIHLPGTKGGVYRAFEISGDSMLPIESGTIVVCKYIEALTDIKDDKTYVILSNENGVVYKRVKKDDNKNRLILISDNQLYLPTSIKYSDIQEIWQYHAHVAFNDSSTSTKENELEQKIAEMQETLLSIQQQLNKQS